MNQKMHTPGRRLEAGEAESLLVARGTRPSPTSGSGSGISGGNNRDSEAAESLFFNSRCVRSTRTWETLSVQIHS